MNIIDFIWNDILIGPIMNGLIVLAHSVSDNYGVAIILFTLIVRVITYPLTLRQLRATRGMQEMQPRMQEIQKKYKDPKRRQEELMKVYREAGFNPLGCLWPLLVQMPIWIALYQVLRRTLGDTPEQLLRLSADLYDWAYITSAIPINREFLFWDLGASSLQQSLPLAILVGATAYIQQKVSTARMGPRDERSESMNRTMLWMMPFMFGFFTLQVPAGLGLYWLVTSIFTIITSYYYYFYRQGLTWSWKWLLSSEPLPTPAAAVAAAGGGTAVVAATAETVEDDESDGDGAATPQAERPPRRQTSAARRRRQRRRRANRSR